MCVPGKVPSDVTGRVPRAESPSVMSEPPPLNVKPGLEIAIFGKCGFHAQSQVLGAGASTTVRRPDCAEP